MLIYKYDGRFAIALEFKIYMNFILFGWKNIIKINNLNLVIFYLFHHCFDVLAVDSMCTAISFNVSICLVCARFALNVLDFLLYLSPTVCLPLKKSVIACSTLIYQKKRKFNQICFVLDFCMDSSHTTFIVSKKRRKKTTPKLFHIEYLMFLSFYL